MKAEKFKGMNGRRVRISAEGVIEDARPHVTDTVIVRLSTGEVSGVKHSMIAEILPQEIGVGDFVAARGDKGVFRVEHIKGGWAWLFSDHSCSGELRGFSDLTLIERAQP